MQTDLTTDALHWADIGDNRVGPLMRELISAIAECSDPHQVKSIARNLKFLSSSVNTMAHNIAARENHSPTACQICKHGTTL